jgi:16S rRNA processing protein RimM
MKVAVAHIKGPRGFKGELAATLYKPGTETLRTGLEVTLQKRDITQECVIESIKQLRGRVALKFTGIENDRAAAQWQGGDVLVEKESLAALDEGEFYHFEIEGAEVVEESGAYVGTVSGIDEIAANNILRVQTENGEILIPFVKAIVKSVDIKARKIVISKVEGLY